MRERGSKKPSSAYPTKAPRQTVRNDAPAGAGPGMVLRLQRSAGNAAVTRVLRQPQGQAGSSAQAPRPPLSASAATIAAAYMSRRFDAASIRFVEAFAGRPPDGDFTAADAQALAQVQKSRGLCVSGKVDRPLLDHLLSIVGPTAAARNALIHLVVDAADLDVSAVLAVRHLPGPSKSILDPVGDLNVGTILIGDKGFARYSTMVREIRLQLDAARKMRTGTVTPVPAAVLSGPMAQLSAIAFNAVRITRPPLIRLVQGRIGATPTGIWDSDTVRHVAMKQGALGLSVNGKLEEPVLAAITTELIASDEQEAVIHLLIDYYGLDRSNAFAVFFEPSPPPGTPADAQAEALHIVPHVGGVCRFYPPAFSQPFSGLVHTVAHELAHVQQIVEGIVSDNVREFLSEGLEIESRGMPEEPIESDADIERMSRGLAPQTPGLLQDAQRMLHHWNRMEPHERLLHRLRFRAIRAIVVNRIRTGTAQQQQRLEPFITRLEDADLGLFP